MGICAIKCLGLFVFVVVVVVVVLLFFLPYTAFIARFRSPSMPPMPVSTNKVVSVVVRFTS